MKINKTPIVLVIILFTVINFSLDAQTPYRPFTYEQVWRGMKKDTLFPSKALGYQKNVSIFTPEKFGQNPDEKYLLIIIFDRQDIRVMNLLLQSIDMLESYGQIPRPVVVGIESGLEPGQRTKEAKWGIDGGDAYGEKFDQFVFEELMPYVKDNYRIDKNQVIIFGHSWFGYHSTMILINHIPELFAVISTSPCCLSTERINDIVWAITHSGPLKQKFFYRIASGHNIGDNLDVYRELTGKINLARLPENFDYKTQWLSAAMHMEEPGLYMHQALYDIYTAWADLAFAYADPENCPTFNDAQLYDSLQLLSDKKYGFRIPIYDRHLEMRVEYYRYIKDEKVRNEGKIATWKFMISKYGETPELYYNIAETYQLLNDPVNSKEYLNKVKAYSLDESLKKKVMKLEAWISSVSK